MLVSLSKTETGGTFAQALLYRWSTRNVSPAFLRERMLKKMLAHFFLVLTHGYPCDLVVISSKTAVCGLPNPRVDHAVAMARFAWDIMAKLNILTKNLETSLGPDTGDLGLRVGMHSGPVTVCSHQVCTLYILPPLPSKKVLLFLTFHSPCTLEISGFRPVFCVESVHDSRY